jgi:cytochrome P450
VLIADFLPAAADRRSHPCDDLLSFIAADPNLSLDEVVVTAILIAVAGHDTTANLLGASPIRLLTPGPDGERLADRIDPNDPAVVTELLRLDSPVQATARTADRKLAAAARAFVETVSPADILRP